MGTIVAVIGSGVVKSKLPVSVREIKVTAQMRFIVEFFPESPFIKVVLVEATGLIQTDAFGTTDAYCKLQLNDVWYRSPTITNTLDPVWNASIEFPLEATDDEQVLQVRVKDWDSSGRNDLQGTAEIYVTRMDKDTPIDVVAYLQNPEREQKGTVHLVITYSPDRNMGE